MIQKNFFDNNWQEYHHRDPDILICDFFRKSYPISSSNFPIAFFPIVGIFAEDCNFKLRKCYIHNRRLFIYGFANSKQCELMLRFGQGDNRLVVARVEFIHTRKGKMTELYRVLKHIQKTHKCGKIEIESVQSEEMENWCLKNGFIEKVHSDSTYTEP